MRGIEAGVGSGSSRDTARPAAQPGNRRAGRGAVESVMSRGKGAGPFDSDGRRPGSVVLGECSLDLRAVLSQVESGLDDESMPGNIRSEHKTVSPCSRNRMSRPPAPESEGFQDAPRARRATSVGQSSCLTETPTAPSWLRVTTSRPSTKRYVCTAAAHHGDPGRLLMRSVLIEPPFRRPESPARSLCVDPHGIRPR